MTMGSMPFRTGVQELMPEPAVRSAFSPADSIEAMAARFDVSQEAMRWRLFNFGLIEERPA